MKVSTAGIVHETTLKRGRSSWSTRPCAGARSTSQGVARSHQVRRHDLCPDRPQDAMAAAQPARVFWWSARGSLGDCWSLMLGVLWLQHARRPGHARARGLPSMRWPLIHRLFGPKPRSIPKSYGRKIERVARHTADPKPGADRLRPGATGGEGCGRGLSGRPRVTAGAARGSAVHERKPASIVRTWDS